MSAIPNMIGIPIIPQTKNYWLVRTQGGKYYKEFRNYGFIGINWEDISIEDILQLSHTELTNKIRTSYPDKRGPGRSASQLRTFVRDIKKGDTVVITGPSSNTFSIGEVLEDAPFFQEVPAEALEDNSKLCSFTKRKKVRWIKELHKWEMEMKFFKLLQHAQNTISDANEYADLIEGLIHDFFIRGEKAQVSLRVTKEGNIPMPSFFLMGAEIIDLAHEFNKFSSDIKIDVDAIDTQINVNSPGKIKFTGVAMSITLIGLLLVGIAGGNFKVDFPLVGGNLDVNMPSAVKVVSDFLDAKQARDHKELVLKTYMKDLDIETPEELKALLETINVSTADDSTPVSTNENVPLEKADSNTSEKQ